ncbi:MAG: GspH/FimT family pseudopilin [Sulfuritalea sp.]|nr:GspH/FimT family pseudopilin [Sulfuritalea sp.]
MNRSGRGFSLVELVIAVAIMGMLLALALPSFSGYLRNVKLRAAAENFLTGIHLARSEALRMNTTVEFLMTTADPLAANVATAAASTAGRNWMVRTADLTTFIDGKFGLEGSGRATTADISVRINDTAPPADADPDPPPAAPVANIIFNGLGRTTLAAPAIFKFNDPDGGARCVTDPGPPAGTVRCLRVVVSVGGVARLCDPAVGAAAVAAGDSRGC